jgi:hypothetical protein
MWNLKKVDLIDPESEYESGYQILVERGWDGEMESIDQRAQSFCSEISFSDLTQLENHS